MNTSLRKPSNSRIIHVLSTNIQGAASGLRLKFGLQEIVNEINVQIDYILVQESWTDEVIELDGRYSKYTQWSTKTQGKGKGLHMLSHTEDTFEKISDRIIIINTKQIIIINIYAPQRGLSIDLKKIFRVNLVQAIDKYSILDKPVCIMGDFNMDRNNIEESYMKEFFNMNTKWEIADTGLATQKYGGNLDYAILIDYNNEIKNWTTELIPLATSDHDGILLQIIMNKEDPSKNFECTNSLLVDNDPHRSVSLLIPRSTEQKKRYKSNCQKVWSEQCRRNPHLMKFTKELIISVWGLKKVVEPCARA